MNLFSRQAMKRSAHRGGLAWDLAGVLLLLVILKLILFK